MTFQIIGSGFGRTDTMTTKLALAQLAFGPCHHMVEVMQRSDQPPHWATTLQFSWASRFPTRPFHGRTRTTNSGNIPAASPP